MSPSRLSITLALVLHLGIGIWGSLSADEPTQETKITHWHQLPLPVDHRREVNDLAIDAQGTLWGRILHKPYFWDGQAFRTPDIDKPPQYGQWSLFIGGIDRPLYHTEHGTEDHQGLLYELKGSRATLKESFYYDRDPFYAGLYVARNGRLFNWTENFLAVFEKDSWERIEASLHSRATIVLETADEVSFFHDRKIYTVQADAKIVEHTLPPSFVPARDGQTIGGCVWGGSRFIAFDYHSPGVWLYDLKSHKVLDAKHVNAQLKDRDISDVFRGPEGEVWLLTEGGRISDRQFVRLDPDGKVQPASWSNKLEWEAARLRHNPRSILAARDGAIWFASPANLVSRYHKGTLEQFAALATGVPFGACRSLLEDGNGVVYAASTDAIFAYRPEEPGRRVLNVENRWQEIALQPHERGPAQDSAGNLWCFLQDRANEISKWDGTDWHHQKVPFDATKALWKLTDDRGHVLVGVMSQADPWHDIGPETISKHSNMEAALVAAVKRGARAFWTGDNLAGCVVLEDKKICYAKPNANQLRYFDGKAWRNHSFREGIAQVYESPAYGFIVQLGVGEYYTLNKGQIQQVSKRNEQQRWLWDMTPHHLFEDELLVKYPHRFAVIEAEKDKRFLMGRVNSPDANGTRAEDQRGDELTSSELVPITPAFRGTFWSGYPAHPYFRIVGSKVLKCDFTNTPLNDIGHRIRFALDDRAGNSWFFARDGGKRRLYLRRTSGFVLRTSGTPNDGGESVTVSIESVTPGMHDSTVHLFWRFKGESWVDGGTTNQVTVTFPKPGKYSVEIIGLDVEGGITPSPLEIVVQSN